MAYSYNVCAQYLTPKATKVEVTLADFKMTLGNQLAYFTEGKISNLPALNILASSEERKDIIFQFPYDNVEELYSLAEQSQVGTAIKTLFKLDARKSREFSTVEVLNQEWTIAVSSVCDKIRHVLAPGATRVTADLYKLLIYSDGDFFKRHQDAQQSDRMFATLLFFLPVDHSGGSFTLKDPEIIHRQVATAEKAAGEECTWMAFYTDVPHEVSQIKKGYRVVLNYSLTFEGAMSPSLQFPPLSPSAASTITSYFSSHSESVMAIPLAYEYTLATLSPEYLKGEDAYMYSALKEVSAVDLQFVIRFDKTRVTPFGVDYYPLGEDYDPFCEEYDHEQMFQGIYVVERGTAKQFFDIWKEKEESLEEFDRQKVELDRASSSSDDSHDHGWWRKRTELAKKFDDKCLQLVKKVKETPIAPHLEWIVKRKYSGNVQSVFKKANISFDSGPMGWLGNMSPSDEYYYLSAAFLVRRRIE